MFSKTCQRSSDVLTYLTLAHYAVILPHTSRDNALIVCEKLHSTLKETNIPFVTSQTGALTLSIGLSSLEGTDERVSPQHMYNTSEVLRAAAEKGNGNVTKADIIATNWDSNSSAVGNYPHIIPRLLQFTPEMPLLSQDTDICLNVLEIKTPFVIVRSVGCFSEFVR
nr:hypothetical protein [Enterovibrio nigricans]